MKRNIAVALVILMVLGAVAFAGASFARSAVTPIDAFINRNIRLTWNGQPFEPREEDGTRLYPIIFEGRTYLPAKFVADKAGVSVDWDNRTQTVSFTTRRIGEDQTVPYLDDDQSKPSRSDDSVLVIPNERLAGDLANLNFTVFDLSVWGDDDNDLDVDYEFFGSRGFKAEFEVEVDDRKVVNLFGEAAINRLLPLFQNLRLTPTMSQQNAINEVKRVFNWGHRVDGFELEVRFNDGSRLLIATESWDDDDGSDD